MSRVYPFGEPGALRVFRLAEKTTSRQDGWLMVQLEDAGILALARGSGLSDEAAARSVMAQAHRSQHYHKIVAAFLIEDGKSKWTAEDAESNAEFIADVSDPEQKETLMGIFVGALQGFFLSGAPSSTPSKTSSTEPPALPLSPRQPGELLTEILVGTGPTPRDGSPTATATA